MSDRMTRKEAIRLIGWLKCTTNREDDLEAIDMAIEALENEQITCEKCIHVKSCRKVIILKNRTYKQVKYCSHAVERRKP